MTLEIVRRLQSGRLGAVLILAGSGLVVAWLASGHQAGRALTAGEPLYVATGAHVSGAGGTNWRTDLEVHNRGSVTASYVVELLKRDTDNSTPPSRSYTLAPGRSTRFNDAVLSLFSFSGAAALRVQAVTGQVHVTSRTFNAQPAGSYGQFVPSFAASEAITSSEDGRIVQLSHLPNPTPASPDSGFRTNIGFVNATAGNITVLTELHAAAGTLLGTVSTSLRPYEYKQVDKIFERVTGQEVPDGYAVLRTTTSGGAFFAYASVIDNRTGDPVFVPAVRVPRAAAPSPTPTPTTSPTLGNLLVYAPTGWPNCVVCNYRDNCCPPSMEQLSAAVDTWVFFAAGNVGNAPVLGPIRYGFFLDGTYRWYVDDENSDGMAPGEGFVYTISGLPIDEVGSHVLEVMVDPEEAIAESDESDNACSFTGTWAAAAPSANVKARADAGPAVLRLTRVPAKDLGIPVAATAPVGRTLTVPTGAHWPGAAGTNWRTDLEVHNPGGTRTSFTVEFLRRNQVNTSPASATFTLGPGVSARYPDAVSSVFHLSDTGALRVRAASTDVIVTSRTFNDQGAEGTYGQLVPGFTDAEAIAAGSHGRIIQLTHTPNPTPANPTSGFRTNIGLVNAGTGAITVTIALYRADGVLLGTVSQNLGGREYRQLDKIFQNVTTQAVDDGFAVVQTTTPGGSFFAYASVIDNRTGDPVYVPAIPFAGSPSPPPTPTTTPSATPKPTTPPPTPSTGTVTAVEIVSDFFGGLAKVGSGSVITPIDILDTVVLNGVDAVLDTVANTEPNTATRIPNGIRVDYGSGTVVANGNTWSGSFDAVVSNVTVASGQVKAKLTVTPSGLRKNNKAVFFGTVTAYIDATRRNDGTAFGRIYGDAASATSSSTRVANADVTFDTAVCPRYPTGGWVKVDYEGANQTFTFSPSCDGTFATGSYYAFELRPMKCDGSAYAGYGVRISMVGQSGALAVNPTCTNEYGPRDHTVAGTVSPTKAQFTFSSWYGDHFYQGTYSGSSTNGVYFTGTAVYTVTAYNLAHDPASGVRCTSTVFTAQGTSAWFTTTYAPCLF